MPEFELDGKRPHVHPDAYVAPTAVLIGDVVLAALQRHAAHYRESIQRYRQGLRPPD